MFFLHIFNIERLFYFIWNSVPSINYFISCWANTQICPIPLVWIIRLPCTMVMNSIYRNHWNTVGVILLIIKHEETDTTPPPLNTFLSFWSIMTKTNAGGSFCIVLVCLCLMHSTSFFPLNSGYNFDLRLKQTVLTRKSLILFNA